MIRGTIKKGIKFIAAVTAFISVTTTECAAAAAVAVVTDDNDKVICSDSYDAVTEKMPDKETEAAQEAFDAILADKDLMALIYLTDECKVYEDGDIYAKDGQIREDAKVSALLTSGHTVYLRGVAVSAGINGLEKPVYWISFFKDGEECSGYVEGRYLAYSDEEWVAWEKEYLTPVYSEDEISCDTASDEEDEFKDIEAFPESYRKALKELKKAHPDWKFVALKTGLDFDTSVSKEMGDKSWISITNSNKEKGWVGDNAPQSGWAYATRSAVAYHMDPRNFLTESYIFQFEQLTFNKSYHNVEAVQKFLDNTFMKGMIPDDDCTYAEAFYNIGSSRKISPVHLASRVYQEQGKGTSALISGTYEGYEGYYNYFNVGATGSSVKSIIENGLKYAKDKGWNSRYKSLEGGAATIGNNYILKGQDTSYLEKFNVDPGSKHAVYTHQYMQNIQAPGSEALSTKKMYAGAGSIDLPFVFKIPVYNGMGERSSPALPINKIKVTGIEAKTYTGNEDDVKCIPVLTLSDGDVLRGIDKDSYDKLGDKEALEYDYTYTWLNIDKAGTAKVKISGVNGYSGSVTKSYKINPASLKELYEGYSQSEGTEGFSIKYYSSEEALMHGLSVQKNGIGLSEQTVREANVTVRTIDSLDEISDVFMRGGSRPQIILYFAGIQLDKKGYSVSYKNSSNVTLPDMKASKLPTITITGKGNLKGSIKGCYTITDGDFANEDKVSITASDKKYAKKKNAWKSTVKIKDIDGKSLKSGTDYDKKIVYTYASENPSVTDKKGNEILREPGDEVDANDIPGIGTLIKATVISKGAYDSQNEHVERSVTYSITD